MIRKKLKYMTEGEKNSVICEDAKERINSKQISTNNMLTSDV